MIPLVAASIVAFLVAALIYWLIITTEGAYLGPRVVRWLYDRGAAGYDRVKGQDLEDDSRRLATPLERALVDVPDPWVLDVGTGTGRMLTALLRRPGWQGRAIGLDNSLPMLVHARRKVNGYGGKVWLVRKNAARLPFPDGSFSAVTCIESLEFLPDSRRGLAEMARVLARGGTLLVTNRVGWEARFFPGRAFSDRALTEILEGLGMSDVRIERWADIYDLVWAKKGHLGSAKKTNGEESAAASSLSQLLRCPVCGGEMEAEQGRIRCRPLGHAFLNPDRILDLEDRQAMVI
ncbi:MAG: class I SAM-dependent methyltransferase [Anaerolineae bacterium]